MLKCENVGLLFARETGDSAPSTHCLCRISTCALLWGAHLPFAATHLPTHCDEQQHATTCLPLPATRQVYSSGPLTLAGFSPFHTRTAEIMGMGPLSLVS